MSSNREMQCWLRIGLAVCWRVNLWGRIGSCNIRIKKDMLVYWKQKMA